MLQRIQRNLTLVLTRLLQMNPGQRMGWVLATLVFALLLGMVPQSLDELIGLSPWLTLLLLIGLILILLTWVSLQEVFRSHAVPPRTGDRPPPHQGLILFLSLFQSRSGRQEPGMAAQVWRFEELDDALNRPNPSWPEIIERFERSNMRPALEAIRHHGQDDVLQHVWLITTSDLETADGEVRQKGSHQLAPLFERVLDVWEVRRCALEAAAGEVSSIQMW
ncbi:MAG: hypothetical protein ACE5LU_27320 [Anaerolineae bacterium]